MVMSQNFSVSHTGGEASGPAFSAPRTRMDAVPSHDAGRKENTAAPAPLRVGGRVPQQRSAALPPAAPLDIPVDEEFLAAEPARQAAASQVGFGGCLLMALQCR